MSDIAWDIPAGDLHPAIAADIYLSTTSKKCISTAAKCRVGDPKASFILDEFDTSLTLGFKLGLRRTLFRFAQQQTVFHFSMIKTSFFTLQCTESKLKQVLLRRVHVQKGNYVKVWRSQHPEEFKLLIYVL